MRFLVPMWRLATSIVISALLFTSCRTRDKVITPETPVKDHGMVNITITNRAGGKIITQGGTEYTNLAGNTYDVSLLKYLISNFTLIKSDNSEHNFGNYKLINCLDSSTWSFTLDSVTNGTYKSIRFYLGVDSAHNHTLTNEGDLNASNGMVWTWSTGYIFFKHEGVFHNDTGSTQNILYHFGTDAALTAVDIPVSLFIVNGDSHTLYLNFDLNSLYAAPNKIDFTNNNTHQSLLATDKSWLADLRVNFPQAFSFVKVQ